MNNLGLGVEYYGTPRKSGGHWVNPRKMEFGGAPLGESETSDFSGLKASIVAKGKKKWLEHNKNYQFEFEDD